MNTPVRTCIGCRRSVPATELLRVVVAPSTTSSDPPAGEPKVVPDPRRRAGGRGAWVHPDQRCVDLASRRRAFARALKVPGPADPAAVREYVTARDSDQESPNDSLGDTEDDNPMSTR